MKKKVFMGMFTIAFLIAASYGVHKSMSSYKELNELALSNVLALANVENPDPGEDSGIGSEDECRKLPNGLWNEALHCVDGGSAQVECTIEGQLNFAGKIINGNYKVGVKYPILWERWKCELSPGNCCNGANQGVNWV